MRNEIGWFRYKSDSLARVLHCTLAELLVSRIETDFRIKKFPRIPIVRGNWFRRVYSSYSNVSTFLVWIQPFNVEKQPQFYRGNREVELWVVHVKIRMELTLLSCHEVETIRIQTVQTFELVVDSDRNISPKTRMKCSSFI